MSLWPAEIWRSPAVVRWSHWLIDSYRRWFRRELVTPPVHDPSEQLFFAPFMVVSHGIEDDPLLNYGNRHALELWETPWQELIGTPSRLTAEPENQPERARMLAEAAARGCFEDYAGIRRSRSGRRFFIEQACVWTVLDADGRRQGQAAMFSHYRMLSPSRSSVEQEPG